MAQTSSQRPHFEPDGASLAATAVRDEAVSSAGALARFEFEAGRGNEGTKILMVEWNEDDDSSKNHENWEVSWEGKSTILSERDGADEGGTHRLYFLLDPNVAVPRIVKISQMGGKTMQTNPLPAIFPPQLGVSARTAGKKGVLHTIWAKKRLSVLQTEIDKETRAGNEGIDLDLAIKEKEWIEENFGIGSRYVPDPQDLPPTSPKSPGGGRLAEKLKGLKLGTSAGDLSPRPSSKSFMMSLLGPLLIEKGNTRDTTQLPGKPSANLLSPETSDVAVSSFALFHGGLSRPPRRAVVQTPPSHIVAQQAGSQGGSGMTSLDAVADGGFSRVEKSEDDHDDDLFAVTLSPRSPEMTTSPFSFSTKDVQR
jgi:hypothetical protein